MVLERTYDSSYVFAFGCDRCQAQRAMVPAPSPLAMPHWSPGSQGGVGVIFTDFAISAAGSTASSGAAQRASESARAVLCSFMFSPDSIWRISPAAQIITTDEEEKPRQVEGAARGGHGTRRAAARRTLRARVPLRQPLRGARGRHRGAVRGGFRSAARALLDCGDGRRGR